VQLRVDAVDLLAQGFERTGTVGHGFPGVGSR
jgi:hypothetical protein